jgi:hypothetical protein
MNDDKLLEAMEAAVGVAEVSGHELMLVGAWARDLALGASENLAKTRDVDFALRADSWPEVHRYFDRASTRFDVSAADLTMRHRSSGAKVDVVPWGAVADDERLRIPNSNRELNLTGLQEVFELSSRMAVGGVEVAVPSPAGMLVLKLLACADRLAPRDLNDVGELLRRFPIDEDPWADPATCDVLADGSITFDDLAVWSAGLAVRRGFGARTLDAVRGAVAVVQDRPAAFRVSLVRGSGAVRLADADRLLDVLALALRGSRK